MLYKCFVFAGLDKITHVKPVARVQKEDVALQLTDPFDLRRHPRHPAVTHVSPGVLQGTVAAVCVRLLDAGTYIISVKYGQIVSLRHAATQ